MELQFQVINVAEYGLKMKGNSNLHHYNNNNIIIIKLGVEKKSFCNFQLPHDFLHGLKQTQAWVASDEREWAYIRTEVEKYPDQLFSYIIFFLFFITPKF